MSVLKYRTSRHARALAQQDVKTLGLLIPDLVNPFFPEVSNGVIEAANERGWQVTIRTTGTSPEHERDVLREIMRSTDAVVGYFNRAEMPVQETGGDVPVVVLDHEIHGYSFGTVRIDVDRAVRQSIEHLIDRGHTEISMLDCVRPAATGTGAAGHSSRSSVMRNSRLRHAESGRPISRSTVPQRRPTFWSTRTRT